MGDVNIFLILALISVGLFVVYTLMIVHQLRKRNYKINYFLLKMMIIKYANDYKKITIAEQGYPARLYYLWQISILMTLLFAIIGIALKA